MIRSPSRQLVGAGPSIGKSDDGWEVLDGQDEKERVQPTGMMSKGSKEDLEGSVVGEERDEGWDEARREA
jgi:hypothetical protein